MKTRQGLILLFLIFIYTNSTVHAGMSKDSLDNTKVLDLTEDWLYYDPQFKSFFPYLNHNKEVKSISQLIDLNKYEEYSLNFYASPGLSLFVDEKLFYKSNSNTTVPVKINIKEIKSGNNVDKELITFYNPEGKLPLNEFFIGHSLDSKISQDLKAKTIEILPRETTKQDVFIISFLSILIILAILRNRYPKKFYEFSRFSNIIPAMDDDVIYDLSSIPVLLFVFINSLCSSLILFLIYQEFELSTLSFLNIFNGKPVLGILAVSVGFFLVFIIKYVYLKILGWIFSLSDLVKIQFFELMKVSFKINLFLAVLTIIFYCSSYFHVQLNYDYFFYFTIISLVIVLMRVGYLSFKLSGFRNIYLFSYLCTTEILPLVIIIKMILF